MGFLKHLLFWPVTGPLFLADFSLGKVQDVVRDELTDDGRVKAGLLELQLKLELGDIDDDQYLVEEAALMQQLRDVRHWREEFGLAVSGGPVRVHGTGSGGAEIDAAGAAASDAAGGAASDAAGGAEIDAADGADDDTGSASKRGAPPVADPGTASIELNLDWD